VSLNLHCSGPAPAALAGPLNSNVSHHVAKTYYDPDVAPNASEWLALPELERLRLAQSYHVAARVKVPSVKAHAAIHAAVENQIATGYGPSKRTIDRLQSEGLSRHEAVHAIGSVVAQFIYELGKGQTDEQRDSFQTRMGTAIEQLHAKTWLSGGGDG
jgi:deoxycytidylate deaminase